MVHVDRCGAHAGPRGNVTGRRAGEAIFGKRLNGGIDEPLSRRDGCQEPLLESLCLTAWRKNIMLSKRLPRLSAFRGGLMKRTIYNDCLLYTSDAADDLTRVDLGGRRIIKKKTY